MSEFRTVKELKAIDSNLAVPFRGIFILKNKTIKTARNGNPFLNLEFGDLSGSFSTNCFNDTKIFELISKAAEGSIFRLAGTTEHYRERFSPKLENGEIISQETAADEGVLEQLIESAPESEAELWDYLIQVISNLTIPALKETVERAVTENEASFRVTAGAIRMHHAYRHGLLEHTVHMLKAAHALLPLYPEVQPELALAGIILHDLGKLEEYEGEFSTRTTRAGILHGHVVLGFRIARKAALQANLNQDLTERLEHIILSHQGEREWGAASIAATPEAIFVSMVDNLDAKMGMVQNALRKRSENDDFSEFIPGLKTKLLLKPPEL